MTDPREEWIAERMAIMDEGATQEERDSPGRNLREMAEADWYRLQEARTPKKQKGMF